jgi:hypothetical protein
MKGTMVSMLPIGLEDPEEKDVDPFSILQGHCTFMAY